MTTHLLLLFLVNFGPGLHKYTHTIPVPLSAQYCDVNSVNDTGLPCYINQIYVHSINV